jgi:uncharacterized protein (DUF1501 family)
MDRREFLKLGVAGAAGAAGVAVVPGLLRGAQRADGSSGTGSGGDGPDTAPVRATGARSTADGDRSLVVIELAGGNDGLNTLVPMEDGRYRDLRPSTRLLPEDGLHVLGDGFGLHPALARLSRRGVAAVAGVGTLRPDGSHFEMMQRWWRGDSGGTAAPGTGFLGRLGDAVGDPAAAAVGVALGGGPTPALAAARVSTLALSDLGIVELFTPHSDDRMLTAFQRGVDAMAPARRPSVEAVLSAADGGMRRALGTARILAGDGVDKQESSDLPGGDLGRSLTQALRLLRADVGVRLVHVTMGGFDTHSGHKDQHNRLLAELDEAVDAFLGALSDAGLGRSTLVATTSEFGRRAGDNGSDGLDHGAASTALLLGPVHAGVHGEPPSLRRLDDDGNLRSTVDMSAYYSTLASWLGADPGEVLARPAGALKGVLRA